MSTIYEYAIELHASDPMVIDVYGTTEQCHTQLLAMGYDPKDWQLVDCMEDVGLYL